MIVDNVVIRSAKQQKTMNKDVLTALLRACKRNKSIPIIYQYLHNPKEQLVVDSDNKMGEAYNIRRIANGDITATVYIDQMLKVSLNWHGIIDNIGATISAEHYGIPVVNAFIVYDTEAKKAIDKKNAEKKSEGVALLNKQLAKPGQVPFVTSGDSNSFMKDASENIMREFNKRMSEQADNQNDEGGSIDE
jgi:hypothetical protein